MLDITLEKNAPEKLSMNQTHREKLANNNGTVLIMYYNGTLHVMLNIFLLKWFSVAHLFFA